jgi:hypothetical protein
LEKAAVFIRGTGRKGFVSKNDLNLIVLFHIWQTNYFMIIVHDIFICKPGNASKIAKLFKEWADVVPKKNVTVMTDMTGQFHRVIIVSSFENLTDYEKEMGNVGQTPEEKKVMEKFKDMNEMYVSGSREIFKVW